MKYNEQECLTCLILDLQKHSKRFFITPDDIEFVNRIVKKNTNALTVIKDEYYPDEYEE